MKTYAQLTLDTKDLKRASVAQLVDRFGEAKAVNSALNNYIKDLQKLIEPKATMLTLDDGSKTKEAEGKLFRVTISSHMVVGLDAKKIRAKMSPQWVRSYETKSPRTTFKCVAHTTSERCEEAA